MKGEDLLKPAADWVTGNWAERLDQCASMLFLHGYIPTSTREKIGSKLEAHFSAAAAQAGWVRKPIPASATGKAGDAQNTPDFRDREPKA